MTTQLLSNSPQATKRLGHQLAEQLSGGDVVLLCGTLGAGKSELARGIAEGLGVKGPVNSPTFTLLNIYHTKKAPLHHFDWYRIEDPEELVLAGLDEEIGGISITLIEWHERAPELIPQDHLVITLTPSGEQGREITLDPVGDFRRVHLRADEGLELLK